jgi:hypothetical protein
MGGAVGFGSELFRLKFFIQYLFFKGFPLFLGENTGVILLTYFHSCLRYLDYGAARAFPTQEHNFHAFTPPFFPKSSPWSAPPPTTNIYYIIFPLLVTISGKSSSPERAILQQDNP